MNILFVTIAWPGENQRNLYSDLISEFNNKGHKVTVICNNENGTGQRNSCKIENGVKVLRIKTGNIKKSNITQKALNLITLASKFKKGLIEHLSDSEFDLILFNTPPITLSKFIVYVKKRYSASVYLLLKDIWPYGFADFGVIKKGGLVFNYLIGHQKRIFDVSDYIGCMSPKGVEFILSNNPELDQNKVEVCPNSLKITKTENRHLSKDYLKKIKAKYGIPKDSTVFIFSGNLGLGHGLNFLVEAILKLRNYEKAYFLIGGAGTHFLKIKKRMDVEKPPNAYVYSYLPYEQFSELMSVCDVGLVLLDKKYSYPQFPSRLLGYLHDKLAVLCAVNSGTDIGAIIENNGAGFSTIHGDFHAFMSAVHQLCEDHEATRQLGNNGFKLLQKEYSVENSYEIIMRHYRNKDSSKVD